MATEASTGNTDQNPQKPVSPNSLPPLESTGSTPVKTVNKRYEGLLMARTKAIKGKGAWYWSHLGPILVHNPNTGSPKAIKLRCCLCGAIFSASNPSRTASEHLKRGTCPNFSSDSNPQPISSVSPSGMMNLTSPTTFSSPQNHQKRSSGSRNRTSVSQSVSPITMVEPTRFSVDGPYRPT